MSSPTTISSATSRRRASCAATRDVGPRVRQQTDNVGPPGFVTPPTSAQSIGRVGDARYPCATVEAAVTIAALPVAALALWALLRAPAAASKLVAQPTGERWHERATPTFGGVGIACGLAAGVALALAVDAVEPSWELAGILAGCGLLFVAGLVDDVRHLSPIAKLVAQFAAAGIAIAAGLRVELVTNDLLGIVIAVFWLVGITNAFNLLDNMDGLAATLATVACLYFAIDAATVHPNDLVLVLSLSLAFACLGFLPFNLRPGDGARVFMGDAGSQLLGFLLAALGLAASWTTAGTTVATMLLPLLVLAIPILDTTLVTVRRLAERRPVTQGGKDHTSHRLVYYGLSETKAVALLALIAVALGRDLGRVQRARPARDHRARRARDLRAARPVRRLPRRALGAGAPRPARRHAAPSRGRGAAAPARRARSSTRCSSAGRSSPSYLLFVDGRGTQLQRGTFLAVLPIVLGTTYVVYVLFGVYRRAWRYATTRDLLSIALASGIATLVAVRDRPRDARPRRLPARGLRRLRRHGRRARGAVALASSGSCPRLAAGRTTAAGASSSSAPGRPAAASSATCSRADDVRVVGFLDDNPRLRRRRVQGVPVLGAIGDAGRRARDDARATSSSSRSPTRRPSGSRRSAAPATRRESPTASSASARYRLRRRPEPSPSERRRPRGAAPPGERDLRRAHARRGARAARRRVPAPRDALRVAGLAARDADDLLGRARDDADLPRDRGDRARGAARRALRLHEPRAVAHRAVLVAPPGRDRVRGDQDRPGVRDGRGDLPRVPPRAAPALARAGRTSRPSRRSPGPRCRTRRSSSRSRGRTRRRRSRSG